MRRQIVLVGLVVFGALSLAVVAQAPKPAASAVKVMKLTDNLFVLNALAHGCAYLMLECSGQRFYRIAPAWMALRLLP